MMMAMKNKEKKNNSYIPTIYCLLYKIKIFSLLANSRSTKVFFNSKHIWCNTSTILAPCFRIQLYYIWSSQQFYELIIYIHSRYMMESINLNVESIPNILGWIMECPWNFQFNNNSLIVQTIIVYNPSFIISAFTLKQEKLKFTYAAEFIYKCLVLGTIRIQEGIGSSRCIAMNLVIHQPLHRITKNLK